MTGYQSKKAASLDEEGFYTIHPKDEDDDIQIYHRPWVELTNEERDAITEKVIGFNNCCGWEDDYAKAIEAKLKEKNT